jgi:class 3 adenylate cyclase
VRKVCADRMSATPQVSDKATAPVTRGPGDVPEIDAERAARAALAIQAAIPEVSAHVGFPIGVHIGVAGGQVVASRTGSERYSE